ncbi:hypothetical protein BB560_004169, partial [Smittium megazygosporum]
VGILFNTLHVSTNSVSTRTKSASWLSTHAISFSVFVGLVYCVLISKTERIKPNFFDGTAVELFANSSVLKFSNFQKCGEALTKDEILKLFCTRLIPTLLDWVCIAYGAFVLYQNTKLFHSLYKGPNERSAVDLGYFQVTEDGLLIDSKVGFKETEYIQVHASGVRFDLESCCFADSEEEQDPKCNCSCKSFTKTSSFSGYFNSLAVFWLVYTMFLVALPDLISTINTLIYIAVKSMSFQTISDGLFRTMSTILVTYDVLEQFFLIFSASKGILACFILVFIC